MNSIYITIGTTTSPNRGAGGDCTVTFPDYVLSRHFAFRQACWNLFWKIFPIMVWRGLDVF
jgi:hypothetical protein